MAGKGARWRRQMKRAAQLDRGLVVADDLKTVIGMCLDEAVAYAASKKLIIRVRSVDEQPTEKTKDGGPHAIVVDVVGGLVTKASTRRNYLLKCDVAPHENGM